MSYSTKMGSNVKIISISQIAFVLLTISMFGGLFFAVWNLKTDQIIELQNLKSENENLQNQITKLQAIVGANPNPHSSNEATVMDTLKRLTRQSGSSQSATDLLDLLANATLAELIEKKLYTIMDCARDDADNLSECSLKPGPKGDKGCLGDQGPQGMNGEPGVIGLSGHNGYPGHKGEVGPKGSIGNPGPLGHRGVKGDMGEIGQRGEAGEQGIKGVKGFGLPGLKGVPGMKGVKGDRGFRGSTGRKGDKGMTGEPGPPGLSAMCGGTGWRKVAFIDMTNTSQNCPQGLTLTGYSKRSCGRTHTGYNGCSSVTFPVGGGQYSRVCGRAKAYQWGWQHSFRGYNREYSHGINAQYVDGLSFTHGTPRTHIWTFAAGAYQGISGDTVRTNQRCPCNQGNTYGSPPFVGNDYFCESGVSSNSAIGYNIFYPDDPLWDGQGCIHGNPCCQLNKPPWFNQTLPTPTTDDIEMRLCMIFGKYHANIALEQMELYVY